MSGCGHAPPAMCLVGTLACAFLASVNKARSRPHYYTSLLIGRDGGPSRSTAYRTTAMTRQGPPSPSLLECHVRSGKAAAPPVVLSLIRMASRAPAERAEESRRHELCPHLCIRRCCWRGGGSAADRLFAGKPVVGLRTGAFRGTSMERSCTHGHSCAYSSEQPWHKKKTKLWGRRAERPPRVRWTPPKNSAFFFLHEWLSLPPPHRKTDRRWDPRPSAPLRTGDQRCEVYSRSKSTARPRSCRKGSQTPDTPHTIRFVFFACRRYNPPSARHAAPPWWKQSLACNRERAEWFWALSRWRRGGPGARPLGPRGGPWRRVHSRGQKCRSVHPSVLWVPPGADTRPQQARAFLRLRPAGEGRNRKSGCAPPSAARVPRPTPILRHPTSCVSICARGPARGADARAKKTKKRKKWGGTSFSGLMAGLPTPS